MRRLSAALLLLAGAAAAQDMLVVAPRAFQAALPEWRRRRAAQGLEIAVIEPPADLRARIAAVRRASGGRLRFVLLLGDVKQIPVLYRPGRAIAALERDPRIATDNLYADLDGDGLPELAVGRLPADNPAEAALLLKKTLDYERNRDFGTWRRRINVIAGMGGFGKLQDWALEQVATRVLSGHVPPLFDLHVTYANPDSAFCPPPARLQETVLERFNEGALLVAYLGHGSRLRLDRMWYRGKGYDIFDEDAAYSLQARRGAPIVFFCCCSTGHVDGAPDCLAEVALKRPGGPVAVIAASRVSLPYGNGVLAKELLDALLGGEVETVGEALVRAKRRLMEPAPGDKDRAFIETLAMGYKWRVAEREEEREEHLYLYNLFGDPALRLPRPLRVAFETPERAGPGAVVRVRGEAPFAGTLTVDLLAPRRPPALQRQGDDERAFRETYARANRWVRARHSAQVGKGPFEIELKLPRDLPPGAYAVRVWIGGAAGAASGARALEVGVKR